MKHSSSHLKLIILQIDQNLAVLRRVVNARRGKILYPSQADDLAAQIEGIQDLYVQVLMFEDAPDQDPQ